MASGLEYTMALLEMAEEKNAYRRIFADLEKVFSEYLKDPRSFTPRDMDLAPAVKQTIGLLIARKKRDLIPQVCANFWKMSCKKEHSELATAEVRSAVALSSEQKAEIRLRLLKRLQIDVVTRYIVDPSIIGGLIVRAGDWFLNHSVRRQLELLARSVQTKRHYM